MEGHSRLRGDLARDKGLVFCSGLWLAATGVWPLSSSGTTESCHVTLLRLFPSNVDDHSLEGEMSRFPENVLLLDKEDFGEGEHDEVGVTGGVRRPEVPIRGVGDVVVVVAVTKVGVVVVDTEALEGVVGMVGEV